MKLTINCINYKHKIKNVKIALVKDNQLISSQETNIKGCVVFNIPNKYKNSEIKINYIHILFVPSSDTVVLNGHNQIINKILVFERYISNSYEEYLNSLKSPEMRQKKLKRILE